jgi:hypothetical protein
VYPPALSTHSRALFPVLPLLLPASILVGTLDLHTRSHLDQGLGHTDDQGLGWYTSVTFFLQRGLPMCTTQGLGLRKRILHTSVIFLRLADLLSVPLFVAHAHPHCTQDDVRPHLLQDGMRRWRCTSRGILEPPTAWRPKALGGEHLWRPCSRTRRFGRAPRFVDALMPIKQRHNRVGTIGNSVEWADAFC